MKQGGQLLASDNGIRGFPPPFIIPQEWGKEGIDQTNYRNPLNF